MKFKFTDEQMQTALSLAMQRHDAKSNSFRNRTTEEFMNEAKSKLAGSAKVDYQYMAHYLGVLGETAWSLHTGEPVDTEIYAVRDDGEDFKGIEVKTMTYMGAGEPELKITVKEYTQRKPPKLYVLVRFDLKKNEAEILGKITRSKFDSNCKTKQYGRNKPMNYVVPASVMDRP
jgi:hypothetical protein